MKIYTKTGDEGTTGLFAGPRVAKDDARIEAYGTVDELNAVLGLVRAEALPKDIDELLELTQNALFAVGAELATVDPEAHGTHMIGAADIDVIESAIDKYDSALPPLKNFILPAGSRATATLHVARGVCRRAERRVVTLASLPDQAISSDLVIYLNRLGDLLFVISRSVTAAAGESDVAWIKPTSS